MPRADKVAAVADVKERLVDSTATVLTEYRGLSVDELAELRGKLRESDATYRVVKNTLARLAARDAGVDIPDDVLQGPTAITFCAGDPVAATKVLRAFSKQHPQLIIKGGVLDGRVLDAAETNRLADLESREELLSKIAGMMTSIIAQPARLALANLTKMAQLLAALQDKKASEPQDVTAAVEAEAEGAANDAAPDADEASADADAPAAATDAEQSTDVDAATDTSDA